MELTPEMEIALQKKLQEIIQHYDEVLTSVDENAQHTEGRAYGGVLRSSKGKLQEDITEELARIAWQFVGGDPNSLDINSQKISIPIQHDYISRIANQEVKQHILENIKDYVYGLSVDKHVFIDGEFVIGIECKAYAENAMIKRILIDFDLLKTQYPNLSCYLFQLESQLGGDYQQLTTPTYGSRPTHTIQSYFSCDLQIITLLEGARKVTRPIHKYFKPLKIEVLRNVVNILAKDMEQFL